VTRKGVAMLLTFWLNLVLLPPTIELQQLSCCEADAATSDKRGSKFEGQDDLLVEATVATWPSLQTTILPLREARPPDPVYFSPPLHKLFCVYLD